MIAIALSVLLASATGRILADVMGNPTLVQSLKRPHYGNPDPDGCLPDEHNTTIKGVEGDVCAPVCSSDPTSPCPTDVPTGVTAVPKCDITFPSGSQGCVLICSPSTDEESMRAGQEQCGAASCQPIQGTGVCMYNAPPPSDLPSGCVAFAQGTQHGVQCQGNASPEPGCEKINRLCCFNQLDDTFAALQSYRNHHPFTLLDLQCPGNFGGGDGLWANKLGTLLKNVTGLHSLALDLSSNQEGPADSILNAITPALQANPGLANFSVDLSASNISDAGASRLAKMLQTYFEGNTLSVSLAMSDQSDLPHGRLITAVGMGEFAASLGNIPSLRNLTLGFRFDLNVTAHGIARLGVGLVPLQKTLKYLSLDLGFVDNNDPIPNNPIDFACFGRSLGGFTHLQTLVLNLDSDINDSDPVRALGVHLACLPMSALVTLNDKDDCHCGLKVEKGRNCIVPNQQYSGDLGNACFECLPDANATACST